MGCWLVALALANGELPAPKRRQGLSVDVRDRALCQRGRLSDAIADGRAFSKPDSLSHAVADTKPDPVANDSDADP